MIRNTTGRYTGATVNKSREGESIEQKVYRMLNNGEKVEGTTEMIYTARKDGVLPGFDIRTDRFEIALEATEKITSSLQAKREEKDGKVIDLNADKGDNNDTGGESTQGTEK